MRRLYEAELQAKECIEHQGWPVDTAPSLAEFVADYPTEPWIAVAHSDAARSGLAEEDWRKLLTQCPQPLWSLTVRRS